jgi:hypothetical protein
MRGRRTPMLLASIGAAFLAANSLNAAVLSSVYDPDSGHTYKTISPNSWTGAEAEAVSLGGHLVTISSATENAFIVANVIVPTYSANPMWIGLYDPYTNDGAGPTSTHAAHFIWSSGEPVTYTNWYPVSNEPNNDYGEYSGAINWHFVDGKTTDHGYWNDTHNAGTAYQTNGGYYGIVEIAPEPASLSLLAIGGACLLVRRRKPVSAK